MREDTEELLKDAESDPFGSYTGIAVDEDGNPVYLLPVQDADDL